MALDKMALDRILVNHNKIWEKKMNLWKANLVEQSLRLLEGFLLGPLMEYMGND